MIERRSHAIYKKYYPPCSQHLSWRFCSRIRVSLRMGHRKDFFYGSIRLSDVISLYALLKLLAEHGGVRLLLAPFHPVLEHLGMSVYSGYALLAGLLCGYRWE